MGSSDMDLIERDDGFWWPASDGWCHKVIHEELPDLDRAVNLAKGRKVAVQAGGNVGVWASHLAKTFEKVVTVEPDEANYECLKRNVQANVAHSRAGFSDAPKVAGLNKVDGNAGAHYLCGVGQIPLITIDSLDLPACDLICLDIEGYEPLALQGAERTIRKYRPVIMFEEKGLSERYYGIKRDTAEQWVIGLGAGYRVKHRVRADVILAC